MKNSNSNNTNPKTIGIVGGTLWGNRGAEAMLVTSIGKIRERAPDARFKVFSYYPREDSQLCQDPNIEFLDCRPKTLGLKTLPLTLLSGFFQSMKMRIPAAIAGKEVSAIRDCDVLLDIGGITFCDGREIFLPFNVLTILPAMLLNVPVIKLSQAMGSFRNPLNRLVSKTMLSSCHQIFARGEITANHLSELGINERIRARASDIAFAYEPGFSLTTENEQQVQNLEEQIQRSRNESTYSVTVIPSSLVHKKNSAYAESMASLIHDLLNADCQVSLLPNATKQSSDKGRNNDLVVIERIGKLLTERCNADELNRLSMVDFDVNTASIRRLMRNSDLVITSRFHGMVAGLAGEIPTVVVGWSHKYGEVLQQFDCQQYSFDYAAADSNLIEQVLGLLTNGDDYKSKLASHLPAVKASAEAQFEEVFRLLGIPAAETDATSTAQSKRSDQCESKGQSGIVLPGIAASSPVLQDLKD